MNSIIIPEGIKALDLTEEETNLWLKCSLQLNISLPTVESNDLGIIIKEFFFISKIGKKIGDYLIKNGPITEDSNSIIQVNVVVLHNIKCIESTRIVPWAAIRSELGNTKIYAPGEVGRNLKAIYSAGIKAERERDVYNQLSIQLNECGILRSKSDTKLHKHLLNKTNAAMTATKVAESKETGFPTQHDVESDIDANELLKIDSDEHSGIMNYDVTNLYRLHSSEDELTALHQYSLENIDHSLAQPEAKSSLERSYMNEFYLRLHWEKIKFKQIDYNLITLYRRFHVSDPCYQTNPSTSYLPNRSGKIKIGDGYTDVILTLPVGNWEYAVKNRCQPQYVKKVIANILEATADFIKSKDVSEINEALENGSLNLGLLRSRHDYIRTRLNLPRDQFLQFVFTTVITLVDPVTQQEENNIILSVDCIADILIALSYEKLSSRSENDADDNLPDINSTKFELSTTFFELLQTIQVHYNTSDELMLKDLLLVEYDAELWIAGKEENELKLVYSMSCVLIFSIYKLFDQQNLSLNPYLHYFIKLWKSYTNFVLLCLEFDRECERKAEEEHKPCETPDSVKYCLKGSSSVRYVLAWILNQNPSATTYPIYDLKFEPLINFIQPIARRHVNGGSLLLDMRLILIALLILDCGILQISPAKRLKYISKHCDDRRKKVMDPFTALGDLLDDLEYDDRFDEDIQYVFEYEYGLTEWLDDNEEAEEDDGESIEDDGESIEFDDAGRDWRELPRGDNGTHQLWYKKLFRSQLDKSFFTTWSEMEQELLTLTKSCLLEENNHIGQKLINSIEYYEAEDDSPDSISAKRIFQFFQLQASEEAREATQSNNKQIVTIYAITNFELILHNNDKLARCLMDQMFMCRGFRRAIIWFLTHNVNLSILLIDYIFELLLGKRGGEDNQDINKFLFTRKGNLILSEVEQLMLLHEFLINCSTYLSAIDGIQIENGFKVYLAESIALKFVTLLCLMIELLINEGIIILNNCHDDDIQDYNNELQILLLPWIGKITEARVIFFKVKGFRKKGMIDEEVEEDSEKSIIDEKMKKITCESIKKEQELLFEKYKTMTSHEITQDIRLNSVSKTILDFFTLRIELHLNYLINNKDGLMQLLSYRQLSQMGEDFTMFFENFNTLCKIEFVALTLFFKFDKIISREVNEESSEETKGEETDKEKENEEVDPEFNNQFLNGNMIGNKKQKNKKKKGKKR